MQSHGPCARETQAAVFGLDRKLGDIRRPIADVVVSVGCGTALDKLDVGTTVVTREQIENSPELTTDQILDKVRGVFIPSQPSYQLQPTQEELSLRGFGSATNEQVLVLVDGVPINDPFFRTVNWSQIPKDQIERIEIIRRGGATSLWGNLAWLGLHGWQWLFMPMWTGGRAP